MTNNEAIAFCITKLSWDLRELDPAWAAVD
jgi:hypothetical protein